MKMKRFHKLLVSIGLSAALTFGMTSAAFADTTTATLQPVETSGNTDSRVTSGTLRQHLQLIIQATPTVASGRLMHFIRITAIK